ncbi:MAG: hypothetical protein LBM21_02050, partial [Coriobacteriales bacterium]|nr:hypothetical protein [Coriobacteriales bacterium]
MRLIVRLRGGGSAFPGLVVEKLDANYAAKVLGKLPYGVCVVSGTNGKTTTTKIVSELLESQGLHVFTNNTGSNFMRGVISALLRRVTLGGNLDADIAVLELDEAHAVRFVERIKPRYSLLLNVMRDQLDRFGEIDYTASLLAKVACATKKTVVINREDARLAAIPAHDRLSADVTWYGLAPELRPKFPSDDDLYCEAGDDADDDVHSSDAPGASDVRGDVSQSVDDDARDARTGDSANASVVLAALNSNTATYLMGDEKYTTILSLKGIYNAYNAAGALALVRSIIKCRPIDKRDAAKQMNLANQAKRIEQQAKLKQPDKPSGNPRDKRLIGALSRIKGAFGRGET